MTDDALRAAILAELIALDGAEPVLPGDITRQDYAEAAGMTPEGAGYRLNKLVREGVLSKHDAVDSRGRRVSVYRRVDRNIDT